MNGKLTELRLLFQHHFADNLTIRGVFAEIRMICLVKNLAESKK